MNEDKTRAFRALHVKGDPLVLWNVWDAGSAKAVADAGASAIATGSWSMSAAQGFDDGEALPLEDLLRIARQIVHAVNLPVSVDFEGGYAVEPDAMAQNLTRLLGTGVIGINVEDRVVGGTGLHPVTAHAARVKALRAAADAAGVDLFINARTDLFFQGKGAPPAVELMGQAMERAAAYRDAGADGLFVPGLADLDLIARLASDQDLPLNVMRMGNAVSVEDYAQAGVSRVSHGPGPYISAMQAVTAAALS